MKVAYITYLGLIDQINPVGKSPHTLRRLEELIIYVPHNQLTRNFLIHYYCLCFACKKGRPINIKLINFGNRNISFANATFANYYQLIPLFTQLIHIKVNDGNSNNGFSCTFIMSIIFNKCPALEELDLYTVLPVRYMLIMRILTAAVMV